MSFVSKLSVLHSNRVVDTYAAVATKTSIRLAEAKHVRPTANKIMNTVTRPSRADMVLTQYRAIIEIIGMREADIVVTIDVS